MAQNPFVGPCGNASNCVLVGESDGGTVRLSGDVTVSSQVIYETQLLADAGVTSPNLYRRPRISPTDTNKPLAILGSMATSSDGGPDLVIGGANARDGGQRLIDFMSGNTRVASLSVNGVLSSNGGATVRAQDGGIAQRQILFGYRALVNGDGGVTFTRAFSSLPSCVCTHVATTNANPCVITTAPSVSAVGFSSQSADTDVIDWQCMGDQ